MNRRRFIGACGMAAAGAALVSRDAFAADGAWPVSGSADRLESMTVYKSPSCGCCNEWVKHVQGAGFTVKVVNMDDLTRIKRDAGVPAALESCHTALVSAYAIEGHVPADLVKKALSEKPKIAGLAVPGMVVGSPGMEQGNLKQPYAVIAWARDGKTSTYARR